MTQVLRQSTQIVVHVGPFVDVTDGFTPQTDITLAGNEAELMKGGATATVSIAAAAWTAITSVRGWYNLTLTTSHTDTIGPLTVIVQDDSDTLPVFARFQVMDAAAFDAMYADGAEGPLQATTVGRKLDVTATGAAGIDWGNVENKTTANDLSGTDIQLVDTTTTNTDMVGTDSAATAASLATAQLDLDTITGAAGAIIDDSTANDTTISDAVWDEPVAGHVAAGSFGATDAAILGDTNELQTDNVPGLIATLDAVVDTVKVDTAAILVDTAVIGAAGAGLTDLGGMSTGMKAEINVEAKDVLFTDTDAEPGQGLPGATISVADKIGFIYKAWRNRSNQTSTLYQLFNDNATTVDHKATVSESGTTAEKGEIETGP